MYEYWMIQPYTDSYGDKQYFKTSLLKAGEMTATELRLPAGSPEYNYFTELSVRVCDRFGDCMEYKMNVTIKPDTDLEPMNTDDTEKITRLLDTSNRTFSITDAGGNNMGLMRVVSSTVSSYASLDMTLESASEISSPDDILEYGNENISDVQNILTGTTDNFVQEIFNRIPDGVSNVELLPADIILVGKSLDKCIQKTSLVTAEASENVFSASRELLRNVRKHTRKKPFPMMELDGILEANAEVIGVMSKNLDLYQSAGNEDINNTLTKEMVEQELQRYYDYHPDKYDEFVKKYKTFDRIVDKLYIKRTGIRKRKKRLASIAKRIYKNIFNALDEAFNITSSTVAFAEPEKVIRKENLNVSLEKNHLEHFKNKTVIKRDGFLFDFNNETLENVTATDIQLKVAVFKKSPFLHANGATGVNGQIMKIEVLDEEEQQIDFPLSITISNEGISYYKEYEPLVVEGGSSYMMYFRCQMADPNDAFITYIKPVGVNFANIEVDELFTLYARSEIIPSEIEFDFLSVVKASDWESNGFKVFIPSCQLQRGDVYIALKPITEDEQSENATLLSRKRRSTDNTTDAPPDHTTANISVVIVTTGCRVYDEQTESWDPSGCSVLPFSSLNETVCRCSPGAGTLFASTFAIPNMIDFHSVWSKFDITNAAVYGTLIAVIVMYCIIFCVLRRLDNRDTGQCLPTFLLDNDFFDTHFYMISVQTGLRVGSATSSNVSFILGGTDADSGVRSLSDGITRKLITNSTNNFILATPDPLGDLVYLRIWHDNSGEGKLQSWYLHRVVITDLHTNDKYIFQCDRWFATDIDDGMIERIIPVLNDINSGFESAFSHTTRINVTENHLWLSLILRPPYSAFSRAQRLSCLLTLLLLAMISNAMFFQTEAETVVVADTVRLGSLSFSFKTLYISIIGAVITVPPIFLFTYLFRNTRRHQRQEENQSHISYVDKLKTMQKLRRRSDKGRKGSIICRQQAKFPPWMSNVAWLLIFIVCAASSFFLILYSMEWGKSKSEEWLTTFILSFVESILIVDPVKVFLLAFLLALILRNQKDDQELHVDLESVRQYSHDNAGLRTETLKDFKMAILSNSVSEQRMEERKQQLKKEKTAKDAFLKFVIHIIFAAILFSISYVNRDQRAFNVKTHISNQLYTSDKAKCGFSKVTSARQFLSWTREVFVPVLFPTADYNGQSISIRDKFLMNDLTNAKIGLVRMRQVRVKKEKCDIPVDIVAGHFCGAKFDTSKEDKSEYCVDCSKSLTANAWTYTEAKDIWGIPIVGHYNTYSGGGYIQNLHNTKATTLAIVDELVEHFWIDRLTRAVFVEFTLYNSNVNLLCYSIFLAEFLETGHGTNWVDTQCFRPSFLTDAAGLFSVLFYLLFIVILLYRTKLLITNMKNQKCSFWKGFWNVIDAFICIFGYSGIVVWVGKFIYTKKALNLYYNDKDVFINFQHIVIWDYVFSIILGFLVFISTLRVMSALEYNKRMTALADTLRHGGRAIFQFSVLVFIGLGAFAVLGYLLFGPAVYEYRNIFVTFGSLTNTLIGRNSLDSMIRAAPTFAEVYFFVYAFFVIFTLLTIFAAVLNDSISHVRQLQLQQPEPIGILNVMKNSIKDMFGLVGIHIKRTDSKNGRKEESIHENTVDTQNVLKLMRDVITLNLQEESKNNMSSKVACGKSSMALSRQNIFLPYDTSRRTSQDKGINAMTYLSDYDETDFEKEGIQTTPSRDYMGFGNRDSLTPDASLRENTATPRDIGINF
ncbi:polycystin-1-like protein 2 [Mytilus trossulus]|uniref:polycystin-1-like protein 2 n=1 Tax=Mytilus trossulus TaxID=6551 RepID=UPI003005D452